MAFHFLLIFTLLNLAFAQNHATLTKEELYWISEFPNTPMPKFLHDILPIPGRSATLNADPMFRARDATRTNKGVDDPIFGTYDYNYGYDSQHGASKKQFPTNNEAPTNKGVDDPIFGTYDYNYGYGSQHGYSKKQSKTSNSAPINKGIFDPIFGTYGDYNYGYDSQHGYSKKQSTTSNAAPINKGIFDPIFGTYGDYNYGYDSQHKASKKQATTKDAAPTNKGADNPIFGNKKTLARKAYPDDSTISETIYFLEKGLQPGTTVNLPRLTQKPNGAVFLPRQVAESMPMSIDKFPEILKNFSLKPGSKAANYVHIAVFNCRRAEMRGEEKHCATSLEAFVDLGISMLGKNAKLQSHELGKETNNALFTIGEGVQSLGQKSVVCHKMKYPYAVYLCHSIKKTEVYKVPLVSQDGTKVHALTVCHKDTSAWSPFHKSFQILKVKPGSVAICHFLKRDTVVWIPS